MALRDVVLGFLVEQPLHGYELKRRLSPALPRERQLNDGVLYPLLAQMERDGRIRKKVEGGTGRRTRHVYRATAKGRRTFAAWLASEADEADEVEYDFMLAHPFLHKCMFFSRLSGDQARGKLDAQRRAATAKLRDFQRIRAGMVAREADPYRLAILDLGIAQQRATLRWLTTLDTLHDHTSAAPERGGKRATV